MAPTAEQKLLDQFRDGNRTALGLLLKSQEKRLFHVCLRMLSNRDDAAEVCQESLLKIVQKIDCYRGDVALATWMVRIAMNQSISFLRKRKPRRTTSIDPSDNSGQNDEPSTPLQQTLADQREPGPQRRVEQEEMLQLLQIALSRIDNDFRAVLVLRDIDNLEYRQIAQVLDLPVGTVKNQLLPARLALREQMLQLCPNSDLSEPQGGPHDG